MRKEKNLVKYCFIVLAAVLVLCAVSPVFAGGRQQSRNVDVAYCVPDTTNPFVGWLTTEVQKLAQADGYNIQIADANNNPSRQIEQVENFIAMKVKTIALMPVDPNNVTDVIRRAQAQGIRVFVAGTDTGVQDFMMNVDQYAFGQGCAEMGIDWIVKTFTNDGNPNSLPAGANKPKVIVIRDTETIDATNRSKGIVDKLNEFGRLNVVIAAGETMVTTQAMNIMENTWQQNSDAVAVFTYNASAAVGVNEYIMGQVGVDKSKFGVFTEDWSEEYQELMNASLQNRSVARGTIRITGPQINGQPIPLPEGTWIFMKDLTDGKMSYGKVAFDSFAKAYPGE